MEHYYTPEQKQTINFSKLVELTNEKPSCEIGVVNVTEIPVSKIDIESEVSLRHEGIELDEITPKINQIKNEMATMCEGKEDREKPRIILEIMRKYMQYGFKDLIVDNKLAQEVVSSSKCKISELVESGFGICRHLSPLYLYFATEVGLSGLLQITSGQEDFTNVFRDKENKSKLFQSKEIGQKIGGHMWANIEIDGKWILVDPSVNLVVDNEYDLQIIKQANYKSLIYAPAIHSDSPTNISITGESIYNPVDNTGRPSQMKIVLQNRDLIEQVRFKAPNLPPKINKFKGVIDCDLETECIFAGTKIKITE